MQDYWKGMVVVSTIMVHFSAILKVVQCPCHFET